MIDVDEHTPPRTIEQLRAHYGATIGRGLGWGTTRASYAPAVFGRPPRPPHPADHRPVYSTRPGYRWPTIRAAADDLGVRHGAVSYALDGGQRRCKGHKLVSEPPPWAVEEDRLKELRRLAATFVRVPPGGRVGECVLEARRQLGVG